MSLESTSDTHNIGRTIINRAMLDGIELRKQCIDTLAEPLLQASQLMVTCLQNAARFWPVAMAAQLPMPSILLPNWSIVSR